MNIDPKSIAIGALGALLLAAFQAAPAVTATAAAPAAAPATAVALPIPRVHIDGIPSAQQHWSLSVLDPAFIVPDDKILIITGVIPGSYYSGYYWGLDVNGVREINGRSNTASANDWAFPSGYRVDPGSTVDLLHTGPNGSTITTQEDFAMALGWLADA